MRVKPVISVVLIGLNEEKLIGKCMESLARQEFDPPFEVIFVDGGSTDRTVSIVRQYAKRICLKIIHGGKSIGDSRERGFQAAAASLIASVDSDVILPADWIRRIYDHLVTHAYCVGVVGPYTVYTRGVVYERIFLAFIKFSDRIMRIISGFYAFRGMNFGIRRRAWKRAGGFERSISALEDVDLSVKVSKFGRVCYLPSLVVETTARRFNRNLIQSILYRMKVYYHRVFLRDYQYAQWEQIREDEVT